MTIARALELAQQIAAAGFIVEVKLVPERSPLTAAQNVSPEMATVRVPLHQVGRRMTLSRLTGLHALLDQLCTLGDVVEGHVRVIDA